MTTEQDVVRLKVKKARPRKRLHLHSAMPLYVLEARIDQMAEEEEVLTRYEHGQEVA
jgi:hypothetical protein